MTLAFSMRAVPFVLLQLMNNVPPGPALTSTARADSASATSLLLTIEPIEPIAQRLDLDVGHDVKQKALHLARIVEGKNARV